MQLLSELTYPFHLTYNIFPFFLVTSPLRSLITYVHGTVFNFTDYKNFFGSFWSVTFCKNVLYFDILT